MGQWRDMAYRVFDASLAQHLPTRRAVNERRMRLAMHRHLAGLMEPLPEVRLEYGSDFACGKDAEIRREGGRFHVRTSLATSITNWLLACNYGTAYLYWLSRCPPEVGPITCTLGDGNDPSTARFAPSTNLDGMIPLPDPYFVMRRGFAEWRQLAERAAVDWAQRGADLVWRGATTGVGLNDPALASAHPGMMTQRLALCLALRGVPGTDVRFSGVAGEEITIAHLAALGIGGDPVPEASWLGRKFAIDVDGNTNTWSNLIIRLHLGCCVLKVASRYGYRQWYYDRLKPWEHYVPVSADLSDLGERIEWVRANDAEAAEIGRRGQAFARSLTWDAVEAEAVDLISANWNRPRRVEVSGPVCD